MQFSYFFQLLAATFNRSDRLTAKKLLFYHSLLTPILMHIASFSSISLARQFRGCPTNVEYGLANLTVRSVDNSIALKTAVKNYTSRVARLILKGKTFCRQEISEKFIFLQGYHAPPITILVVLFRLQSL